MHASKLELCPFCAIEADRIVEAGEHAFVVLDAFPVSPGHSLVISRRHVADIFDLTVTEISEIIQLLGSTRRRIDQMLQPTGYNVGVNVGRDSGQTVMHVHVHVIPRYPGDVAEPAVGVRAVIPGKRLYP
jgi:diadenosine tetraphosphate (Ap4A) HIT family hydrolase